MAEQRARRVRELSLAAKVARIAIPTALVGVVTMGVIVAASPAQTQIAYPASVVESVSASPSSAPTVADRQQAVSRGVSSARSALPSSQPAATMTAEPKPKPKAEAPKPKPKAPAPQPALKVTGKKYATVALKIRTEPSQKADSVAIVKPGRKISVTDVVRDGYRYISFQGKGRWVKKQYLANKKPSPASKKPSTVAAAGGISASPCKSGTGMESGLTSDAKKVHRALCALFPQVTSFGGMRGGGGNHGSGRAVDCMISNKTVGLLMANWLRAHAEQLGVSEVIYRQRIWTVQRSSEGWRSMADRGSVSANHFDHVHVSVYGSRAQS